MSILWSDPSPSVQWLTVPGLSCSGATHWQTLWEIERPHCSRIELPRWDDPDPVQWIEAIDRAVKAATGKVVLAAHSLGCHAVVGWARRRARHSLAKIKGAVLVAPPDPDAPGVDPRIARFARISGAQIPFPALLVASHDDPYASFERSEAIAAQWSALLVDAGAAGHINAESGLGSWPEGQRLVEACFGPGTRSPGEVLSDGVVRAAPFEGRPAPRGAQRRLEDLS